ncbi:MAG: hydroxyisourate hydrolase [Chloroflexi bacterium]|nr:hydroxyisourate hydrolase [Chloroflexota bacterium]
MITVSTHVLDIERGLPASGLVVTLSRATKALASATTDDDGRIAQLANSLQPGTYLLTFDIATYLNSQGRAAPFLQRVSLEVAMHDDRHYHVPLLLSAYACTTYRGS